MFNLGKFFGKKRRIFLDHASATPLDEVVFKSMQPFFGESFANPGALYKEGVLAKEAISKARTSVAKILNCNSSKIFFTASGTESINLAIQGVFKFAKQEGFVNPHIITSQIEHPAVLETCKEMEKWGAEVSYLPVSEDGLVSSEDILNALKENTVLVSIIYAHNEIGVIEPVAEIAKKLKERRLQKTFPLFHIDASQAPNYLSVNVETLGADLLTLDGSKIYGPKGVGMLYIRNSRNILPIIYGGGQEGGLRSGTENVPLIVGFAEALKMAQEMKSKESERLTVLRDYFLAEVSKINPKISINGSLQKRLPNNISICLPGLDAEFAVIKLDSLGIACSHVTSCKSSGDDSSSYSVRALGKEGCSNSSLRFTLGRTTSKQDILHTIKILKKILK